MFASVPQCLREDEALDQPALQPPPDIPADDAGEQDAAKLRLFLGFDALFLFFFRLEDARNAGLERFVERGFDLMEIVFADEFQRFVLSELPGAFPLRRSFRFW